MTITIADQSDVQRNLPAYIGGMYGLREIVIVTRFDFPHAALVPIAHLGPVLAALVDHVAKTEESRPA